MVGKGEKKPKGFKFANARQRLESAGLTEQLATPDDLPVPDRFDARHREWLLAVVGASRSHLRSNRESAELTHGRAAKLINVHLKARFECGPWSGHARVGALHPPIDSMLLDGLEKNGPHGSNWTARAWWDLDNAAYESLVERIRQVFGAEQL